MPTPAAAVPAAAPEPPLDEDVAPRLRFGKKKLIVIAAALALVLVAGTGTAVVLKKRAAAKAAAEGDPAAEQVVHKEDKPDPKAVPTFVALEMFTVNLADRETERYAQIGITLELANSKATDRIKAYMPAIRNNILMVLSQKTSLQLLDREGKERLAFEILRESVRPLGYDVPEPGRQVPVDEDDPPPVKRVHFANFIIQ